MEFRCVWLFVCVFLIISRRSANGLYCRYFNVQEECKKCRAQVECNCLCSKLAAISHCAPYLPPSTPPPHQLMLKSIHTSLLRWREAQFNLLFCLLAVYFCFALCAALTCHFIPSEKPQVFTENGFFYFRRFNLVETNRRDGLKTHFKNWNSHVRH
jgi:hypothetical protein